MNKISVFIHLSRKTYSLPPRAGLSHIKTVPNVRTCYKQKKWKAQCWGLNPLAEEEKSWVINQILQAFHTKSSLTNGLEILLLLHGEAKPYFSLGEVAELLGCSSSVSYTHLTLPTILRV